MAGLKKARKLAQKAAEAKKAKQQYRDRAIMPQAPKYEPTSPWIMTTADITGGNTER